MKKTVLILLALMTLPACSTFDRVFPSTRDEYRRAESMPDLEIPPDLTRESITDLMGIPTDNRAATATAPAGTAAPVEAPRQAQMQASNGRDVIAIPAELPVAWTRIANLLTGLGGVVIDSQDQQAGTLNVTYTDESRSWFQSLLRGNRSEYVIRLSAVGTTTELIILDEKGEWNPTERSDRLLADILSQYNMANSQPQ